MTDAIVLERRRATLKTVARLQRRNVGVRWRTLRSKRLVQWVEAGIATTQVLRDSGGARRTTRRRRSGWVWLAGAVHALRHTRGGWMAGALRVLRRPSLWSFAMFATRWWWRRSRRAAHDRAAIAM